jgi:hypothetical protein
MSSQEYLRDFPRTAQSRSMPTVGLSDMPVFEKIHESLYVRLPPNRATEQSDQNDRGVVPIDSPHQVIAAWLSMGVLPFRRRDDKTYITIDRTKAKFVRGWTTGVQQLPHSGLPGGGGFAYRKPNKHPLQLIVRRIISYTIKSTLLTALRLILSTLDWYLAVHPFPVGNRLNP